MNTHNSGDEPKPGSNVLILAERDNSKTESWIDLVTTSSPDESTALVVSDARSSTTLIDEWQDCKATHSTTLGIVAVGELTRSASAQPDSTVAVGDVTITPVSSTELTELGIAASDYLTRWEETMTRVWVDSLASFVEAAGMETVFRFLHLFTGRIRSAEAVAYYRLDPTAYDTQTVNSLIHLFDTVIEGECIA